MIAEHMGRGDRTVESLGAAYQIYRDLDDTTGIAETALRWGLVAAIEEG